jgi:hypothetical protein
MAQLTKCTRLLRFEFSNILYFGTGLSALTILQYKAEGSLVITLDWLNFGSNNLPAS